MTKRTAYIITELLEIERLYYMTKTSPACLKNRLDSLRAYCKADELDDYEKDFDRLYSYIG